MTNTNDLKCSAPNCQNPARFNAASSLAYPARYVCSKHLWVKKG